MFSRKDLQRLIIPLIVEQFLSITIGMADTVMVSVCGEAAVSGVSLVDAINILMINIFSALATGGAIVSSQYIGREDLGKACEAAKRWCCCLCPVHRHRSHLCLWRPAGSGTALPRHRGRRYGQRGILLFPDRLSYPFIALYNAGAALFRAMGNSKVSMTISIVMNCINIGGQCAVHLRLRYGRGGAALATLISRIVGAVFILVLLRRSTDIIHIDSYLRLGLHPGMIKNILEIGIPNGLENGMFQLGKIIVQGMIASYGTAAIAANAVCNSIAGFPIIPGSAIGLALITVVGQCVGAQRYEEAKQYIHKLTGLAYLFMFFFNALIAIFCSQIVGFFSLSAEATDTAVLIMLWHSLFCAVFWPAAFTMPNGLRAANDVRFTMTVSILSMWICRICMSYILGTVLGMGALGTWFAMFLDWIVRIVFFAVRLHSNKWQHRELQQKMAAVELTIPKRTCPFLDRSFLLLDYFCVNSWSQTSSSNQKVLPSPSWLSTPYRAWCACKISLTMQSPKPLPGTFFAALDLLTR